MRIPSLSPLVGVVASLSVLSVLAACAEDSAAPTAASAPAAAAPAVATSTPAAVPQAPVGTLARGPLQALGEGTAGTYVISGPSGEPLEVGVTMTGGSMNGLPEHTGATHPAPLVLALPSDVSGGVLDHVQLYWNPQGHEPAGIFDKAHFDYHFYLVDPAEVSAIDPAAADFATKAAALPDPKYMPADFVIPPGPTVQNTVPGMGLHWLDSTDALVPDQYNFTEVMINGSYDGKHTFIEPMITREWLMAKNTLTEPLKVPQAYQQTGMYPTTYTVRHNPATDEYTVALGGFTMRQAS